jgi:hypothetical protein
VSTHFIGLLKTPTQVWHGAVNIIIVSLSLSILLRRGRRRRMDGWMERERRVHEYKLSLRSERRALKV